MNKRNVLWSAVIVSPLLLAAATAAPLRICEAPALASAASPHPTIGWSEPRAAWSPCGTTGCRLPEPEVGLTVGRDLTPRFSVELTGSAREVDNDHRRSWSALAAVRWAPLASANGRHALTIAGGPFLEIDNVVHGTLPFAHAEVAYVYRAPVGLTVLAGGGPNVALASSPYVAPPSRCDTTNSGDSSPRASTSAPTRTSSTRETRACTSAWRSAGSSEPAAGSGRPAAR